MLASNDENPLSITCSTAKLTAINVISCFSMNDTIDTQPCIDIDICV